MVGSVAWLAAQSRPTLRRVGQTHRLAMPEAGHGEWSLSGCTAAAARAHGRRRASRAAPLRRRSTVDGMRPLGRKRPNGGKRDQRVAELRRLLAMIQKGDDAGIDPDDVLDLLNRANVSP